MAKARIDLATKAAFVAAVVLALVAVAMDNATVSWTVAPIAFVLLFFAMSRVPLRYSLMVVMFCALTLENPAEAPAVGLWQSPLYALGVFMLAHLNQSTGVSWMSISGIDLLLIFSIAVALFRRATRSTIDGPQPTKTPSPLIRLAFLSLAGTAFVWASGLLRGGDPSKALWQVEKVTYLPILFLLFQAALRNTSDYVAVGRVILGAAVVRALLAIYVMRFSPVAAQGPAWATTHHDSVLFAAAVVILGAVLMHRARRDALKLVLLLAPIILWGMVENNRRMVWVQIVLVFVTLYFVTPPTPAKRKIRKYMLLASPLIVAYVAIGWRSGSRIFKPVWTLKSVIEPATDLSTMTRDIENYDLAMTIKSAPIFGLGYGHPYLQIIQLPPMPYPLEPWLPHNSLLGLWFAAGFVGYTAMTLLWTAGVYFGVRAYKASTVPMDKAAALVSFGTVLIYLIQCYGDIGLGAPTGVYIVAASLAVAGKLAVAAGAWSAQPAKRRSAAARAAPTH